MKYDIGQYVMYRNNGVCRVEAIGKLRFCGITIEPIIRCGLLLRPTMNEATFQLLRRNI